MEAPPARPATPDDRPAFRRDLALVLALVALAVALRAWSLRHTEVAARDSIGFIRYAWRLRHEPWPEVVRTSEQHPGYPALVLAASEAVRHYSPGPDHRVMQRSAQLAASACGVLLVVPMFLLGRELFDRRVGFWAAAAFQCLPAGGRTLADGLSEPTFLLFAVAALWLGTRALRDGSAVAFAAAGLCGGLAYLTRPEGGLVVGATGLVLLGAQAVRAWRRPWRRVLVCGAALGAAALAVGGPLVAVTGKWTTKPTGEKVLRTAAAGSFRPSPVVAAAPLAVWWPEDQDRLTWGLKALGRVWVEGGNYVLAVPALLGLVCGWRRLRDRPGTWLVLLVCLGLCLVLWRVAVVAGYLSDRHMLLVLLGTTYWAAAGTAFVGDRVGRLYPRGNWCAAALLAALAASGLPKVLEPLHANRSGFRDAGLWLAEHAAAADPVLDPYCWAHYYAGRLFLEGRDLTPPPGHTHTQYVVLERGASRHERLPTLPVAEELARRGQVVYRLAVKRGKKDAEVFVYAVR